MALDKGYHWSVAARQARLNQNKQNLPFRGVVFAKVTAPVADREEVVVDSFLGQKTISYAYPFSSTNSWIRGQPEEGTTVVTVIGGDSKDIQPISYFDPGKANKVAAYVAAANQLRANPAGLQATTPPYRNLTPGDVDMASNFAQTFLGLRDVHQSRGGLSHWTLTSQRARLETPLFEVLGSQHAASRVLNDEIRFGTVRRVTPLSNPALPSLVKGPLPATNDPTRFPFAKEFSMVLDWYGLPGRLLDHRQGIVVEDDGTLARGQKTQRNLRARWRWASLVDTTRAEIDEGGNWYLGTSLEGTDGGAVEIPTGSFLLDVGQRINLRAKSDVEIASLLGRLNATANAGFRVATPALGEVEGTFGLQLKSAGSIQVDTPMPLGIQLGTPAAIKYPVLVANPSYVGSLQAWYSAELGANNMIAASETATAQAMAAIGPLMMLLDPSGATTGLCMAAGTAAVAAAAGATAAAAALTGHMPTLASMPAGFVSSKTVSE